MKFLATHNVLKRLQKGKTYHGGFVTNLNFTKVGEVAKGSSGIRIAVVDDTGKWMTFNPNVFVPATMKDEVTITGPSKKELLKGIKLPKKKK